MPWKPSDAPKHTKKAKTPKQKLMWQKISNSMLDRGASEGAAIRAASGVVKKRRQGGSGMSGMGM